MKYMNLGDTGLSVSRLCLGMMTYGSTQWHNWILEYDASRPFVERALDAGINFFDTADVYSDGASEEVPQERDRILRRVAGTSRHRLHRSVSDPPLRPQHAHRGNHDALDSLVVAGKVRYLGASSMFAWQMAKYLFTQKERGAARFVSMQNHYNLLYREEEREMNPLCADQGVGLIPWSPLARGYLGRTPETLQDTVRAKSDEFTAILYKTSDVKIVARNAETAARLGITPAQAALAWLLSKPGVTAPIIGASKLEQLDDAIGAVDVELSADDIEALE